MNFRTSTQLKNWTFKSVEELKSAREKKLKRVGIKLKKAVDEWNKREYEKPHNGHKPSYVEIIDGKIGKYQLISLGDEIKYINALILNIIKICEHMKFPDDVLNTAIEYLKRFYLKQSVYDFDAVDMMFTAVYLAVKVEETPYGLSDFARVNAGCTAEKIVQNETFLIKGLKFQFFVFSPYRSFDGFYKILEHHHEEVGEPVISENLDQISQTGRQALRKLHYTDCSLLYSPSLIGYAALSYAFKKHIEKDILDNDALVNVYRKQNVFDYNFWEKQTTTEAQEQVSVVANQSMTSFLYVYLTLFKSDNLV